MMRPVVFAALAACLPAAFAQEEGLEAQDGEVAPATPEAPVAEAPPEEAPVAPVEEAPAPIVLPEATLPTPEATATKKKKKVKEALKTLADTLNLTVGGIVQYDLRIDPTPESYGTWFNPIAAPPTVSRNELLWKSRVGARVGKFGAKIDVDFVLRAYPNPSNIDELSNYQSLTPFRFEAHELYIYATQLGGPNGIDLRIGQQKAMFGVGDQFNPTNTVTPNDVEDVLLFGDQMGNLMVRADWTPKWNWQITGILVPIFKPMQLPRTSYLGQRVDRLPFTDDQVRWNYLSEIALGGGQFSDGISLETFPTIVRNVNIQQPEFSAENMQGFFRVGATLGGQDIALSYYRGFSDVPQAFGTDTYQDRTPRCQDPNNPDSECIDGLLLNDITLSYPRMHVLGFNMTGEFKIGYRIEAAVIFPEAVHNRVTTHDIQFSTGIGDPITQDGPYPFPNENSDLVVDSRPFAKWVVGIDYTFGKHVYLNAQWVHGFPDEFGAGDWMQPGTVTRAAGLRQGAKFGDCVTINFADFSRQVDGTKCAHEYLKPRIGDYLVLGLDVNFAAQRGLFRLFTIWDLIGVYEETWNESTGTRDRVWHHMFTPEGFSAVLYPDLRWKWGNGFETHVGALIMLGDPRYSKFGSPETGGTQVWFRAKYSY